MGTTTPAAGAALDITSANKGLLLPRVSDTTAITNPTAGLLIYNNKTKTPTYHNGTAWNAAFAQSAATADSVTYTITGATTGFTNGTFGFASFSHALGNPGNAMPSFSAVSFVKTPDINSTGMIRAITLGTVQNSMVVEFKVFSPGSSTPRYSIKLTNLRFTGYEVKLNSTASSLAESVDVTGTIYGYKNWVDNTVYAWDIALNRATTY